MFPNSPPQRKKRHENEFHQCSRYQYFASSLPTEIGIFFRQAILQLDIIVSQQINEISANIITTISFKTIIKKRF